MFPEVSLLHVETLILISFSFFFQANSPSSRSRPHSGFREPREYVTGPDLSCCCVPVLSVLVWLYSSWIPPFWSSCCSIQLFSSNRPFVIRGGGTGHHQSSGWYRENYLSKWVPAFGEIREGKKTPGDYQSHLNLSPKFPLWFSSLPGDNQMYQYFITVVPTRLVTHKISADTHQFSVTERVSKAVKPCASSLGAHLYCSVPASSEEAWLARLRPSTEPPSSPQARASSSALRPLAARLRLLRADLMPLRAGFSLLEVVPCFQERVINHAAGSHGVSGIFVKYDTSSLTVTVTEQHMPLWQFLVRLCGIVGGIFSTTGESGSSANIKSTVKKTK